MPQNGEFDVWEHFGYRALEHKLNIILGTGVKNNPPSNFTFHEMLVDWVKVYQRTPAHYTGVDYVCHNQTFDFLIEGVPSSDILGWEVSPNLQIVQTLSNGVRVKPIGSTNGTGWIEVHLYSSNSCYGHQLRKNVWVGYPEYPQISTFKNCQEVSLMVTNFNSDYTYTWQVLQGGNGSGPYIYNNGAMISIPITPSQLNPYVVYRLIITNECGESTTIINTIPTYPCKPYGLIVYPNPASGIVNVTLDNFTQEEIQNNNLVLHLIDEEFNILKSTSVSQLNESIDISGIENGFRYFFTTIGDENIISNKFIIQH